MYGLMQRTSIYHFIKVVWTFIILTLWAQDYNLNTVISSPCKDPTTSAHNTTVITVKPNAWM